MGLSQRFWRGLVFLLLIAALCGGMVLPMLGPANAAPQMQVATNIVISEFRTRGLTGGNDEFVELYNPTINPVDISNWIISGSNMGGTTNTRATIPVGTTLQPSQHYLVAKSGGYSGTVTADLLYTAAGIPDDGGIALISADGITIIDQVGMNAGSAYKEGTTLSPLSGSTDQSYERVYDVSFSCIDSTNNATDFFIRNPSDPQNSSSPVTTCGDPNPLLTATAVNLTNTSVAANQTGTALSNNQTGTAVANQTGSAMPTASPIGLRSVIISEVAWMGTQASGNEEWIELYNPSSQDVDLSNWRIVATDGIPSITIPSGKVIRAGGFFLLEASENAVIDAVADHVYGGSNLSDSGESLLLLSPLSPTAVDTANANGGPWPAGNSTFDNSMERVLTGGVPRPDSDTAWISNVQSSTWTKHDSRGTNSTNFLIRGTPGYGNWAFTVTPTIAVPTQTRTATPRPSPTRTLTPPPPPPLVAINEFVPRPGHDWNNDGVVNVQDEYIEIINHGVIDVNLGGYSLDDEVNIGSSPYSLPSITISPGERIVFYGSETNLLLSDGGDGVRLLSPNGQLTDAYNYRVVRFPDQSFCRLPDNGGLDDWNTNCFPTPGLQNALSGSSVSPPSVGDAESQCPIADILPIDFILAECPPFGNNIWSSSYWDETGWYDEKYLPESPGKWPVFAD